MLRPITFFRCNNHSFIKKNQQQLRTYLLDQRVVFFSPSAAHPLKCLITLDMDSSLPKPRRPKQMVWLQAKHLAFERQFWIKCAVNEVKQVHYLLCLCCARLLCLLTWTNAGLSSTKGLKEDVLLFFQRSSVAAFKKGPALRKTCFTQIFNNNTQL